MEKRMREYLAQIDLLLQQPTNTDRKNQIEQHLIQISFFQHERLVHLMVTIVFALLEMMSFLACMFAFSPGLVLLTLLILVLLIPYIRHYYILENGVQKMYRQYDIMVNHRNKKEI